MNLFFIGAQLFLYDFLLIGHLMTSFLLATGRFLDCLHHEPRLMPQWSSSHLNTGLKRAQILSVHFIDNFSEQISKINSKFYQSYKCKLYQLNFSQNGKEADSNLKKKWEEEAKRKRELEGKTNDKGSNKMAERVLLRVSQKLNGNF